MAALKPPYRQRADGLSLAVRVTPKARRDAIEGLRDGPDGPALAVAVNAMPEDGKANDAVVKLIAAALDLPKAAVTLAQGGKSRHKTLQISGPADVLAARLDAIIAGASDHG
ncbi:MAG TPA: DUF167 family protein [Alphaproteobacteria bacterium]|nr:DUF167 family protein [Alphaproteobacteria bacterium]